MSDRFLAAHLWLILVLLMGAPALADKEPCHPVPPEAVKAYRAWGHRQTPKIYYQSCDTTCTKGLRLCTFADAGGNRHAATCNGRDVQEPCRLVKRRSTE